MKHTRFTLMIFGMLLSCFTLPEVAKAEGSRSYIAPGGSDNRACSRSQPCRTFDGALVKTDEGGEIIALETSTYDPTTITKSITLTAAPAADVVIRATSGNAVTINAGEHDTVVLRGLKLSGPGKDSNTNGVLMVETTQGMVIIENCVISNFGTGVHAVNINSARLGITDSVMRNNQTGLLVHLHGADMNGAFATSTRFEHNSVGAKILGGKQLVMKSCVAVANNIGILADPSGTLVISDSLVTKNQAGIEARGTARIFFSTSHISGNGTGLKSDGVVHTMGNNMLIQNDVDHAVPGFVAIPGA